MNIASKGQDGDVRSAGDNTRTATDDYSGRITFPADITASDGMRIIIRPTVGGATYTWEETRPSSQIG